MKYAFDGSRSLGERIDPADVTIDGVALDWATTYRVAALVYAVIGADGYSAFKSYIDPVRNNTDRETFAVYLKAQGTLTLAPLDRVTRKG